jgi:D-aminopeptidase
MRIVLSGDMEGISQVVDAREVSAAFPEYWLTGRDRYNDDVRAAARGLVAGGATEVLVLDNHASGNPENLVQDGLPEGARIESLNVFDIPGREIDGMFQVGYHARAGIHGFLSHTYSPYLKLRVNDELIGESHGRIWAAQIPLLGIVGTDAHGASLGSLAEAPFLVVQKSASRQKTTPSHADPDEAAAAIEEFARACMRSRASAPRPSAPARPEFHAHLACAEEDRQVMIRVGWSPRDNDDAFSIQLESWADARAPLYAAMDAANGPMNRLQTRHDLTSAGSVDGAAQALAPTRDHFLTWAAAADPEW